MIEFIDISLLHFPEEILKIKLKYPELPTINMASAKRPILVPAELIIVPGGQVRSSKVKGDMTAQLIRLAAVKPEDRMRFLTDNGANAGDNGCVVNVLRSDKNAETFGLHAINPEPMLVKARLLPPAKLMYGQNNLVDTKLAGAWNLENKKFFAPTPTDNYICLIVSSGDLPRSVKHGVETFVTGIDNESRNTGLALKCLHQPMLASDNLEELRDMFADIKDKGAKICLCIMMHDCYSNIKYAADWLGLVTQCIKWKNVERTPRGFFSNVLMKMNSKLGGTNHTLIQRGGAPPQGTFQSPPNSLSWVLDVPCMFVGIDVSHPDPGSDRASIAAVVGSLDGMCSEYVTRISCQTGKTEVVAELEESMYGILTTFKGRHGALPQNIVVYRDGVSDSQFDEILSSELKAIKGALALHGQPDDGSRISFVIVQKNHHTRLVYEENSHSSKFHNPSPGVVVDAVGGKDSICSPENVEFYLCSHATIQGTSKPTKYTMVYDEIGMRLSEVELMTYWLCYLYVRCTRSVSMATPVYYAHWAAKRGKAILSAGGTVDDLKSISDKFGGHGALHMFFV